MFLSPPFSRLLSFASCPCPPLTGRSPSLPPSSPNPYHGGARVPLSPPYRYIITCPYRSIVIFTRRSGLASCLGSSPACQSLRVSLVPAARRAASMKRAPSRLGQSCAWQPERHPGEGEKTLLVSSCLLCFLLPAASLLFPWRGQPIFVFAVSAASAAPAAPAAPAGGSRPLQPPPPPAARFEVLTTHCTGSGSVVATGSALVLLAVGDRPATCCCTS